ncbi:MAG: hypothetical protein U0354_07465 [Candidatus Sericytochromatia bacterium]
MRRIFFMSFILFNFSCATDINPSTIKVCNDQMEQEKNIKTPNCMVQDQMRNVIILNNIPITK